MPFSAKPAPEPVYDVGLCERVPAPRVKYS